MVLPEDGDHPMTKLSDTQAVILSAASQRDDLSVLPLPDSLTLKGRALNKVMGSLKARGLIEPAQHDRVDVLRVELDQARLATRLLACDQGRPGSAEGIEHNVPALARVPDRPLDQGNGLHGRMQVVTDRLVEKPHIALVAGTAPVVVGAFLPAVEDRLLLALVVGPAEREGVLRPDDERRPLAARGRERPLQGVQLRAAHAHVHGALGD